MADFDPSKAQIRIGLQKVAPQIPAETLDRYTAFSSEELSEDFGMIEFGDTIIDGGKIEIESLEGPLTAGPQVLTFDALSANSAVLAFEYDLFRYSKAVATPGGATNAREHFLAYDRTLANDWNSTVKALSVEVNRDDGHPKVVTGAHVNQAVYTFAGGQVAGVAYQLVWLDNTPFAAPTVVSDVTPNTKQPVMVGILNGTEWAKSDKVVHVQVQAIGTGSPPDSVTFAAKVGTAASYGPNTFTISNFNVDARGDAYLVEVIDSTSGEPLGTIGLPTYMFVEDSTGYEVTGTPDEWTFDPARGVWTPTFGSAPRFNTVDTCLTIDGQNEYPQNFTITVTRPFGPPDGWVCGRRPPYVIERGVIQTVVDFSREIRDRTFVERIEHAKSASMTVNVRSNELIETGQHWNLKMTLPNMKPAAGQRLFTVTGAQERGEETQMKAFSGAYGGANAQLVHEWRTDVADPTA